MSLNRFVTMLILSFVFTGISAAAANKPNILFILADDPGETINVYSKHPKIVAELKALLEEAKTSGRTAPKR